MATEEKKKRTSIMDGEYTVNGKTYASYDDYAAERSAKNATKNALLEGDYDSLTSDDVRSVSSWATEGTALGDAIHDYWHSQYTPVSPGDGTNDDITWEGDEWYDNALAQYNGEEYDASVLANTPGYDSEGTFAGQTKAEKEATETDDTDQTSETGYYSGYNKDELAELYSKALSGDDTSKKAESGGASTQTDGSTAKNASGNVTSGNADNAGSGQAEYSIQALQDYFSGNGTTDSTSSTASTGTYSYNLEADPIYQQYKAQYLSNGQKAMEDTIGTASSLTGGYGNSYAQTAGQQVYNQYMSELGDVALQLENQAYSRYRDTVSDNQWQQSFDYQKERDAVSDSQWQQSFEYQQAQDAITEAMNQESQYQSAVNNDIARSSDAVSLATTLAQSGYTEQQILEALSGVYGASVDDASLAQYAKNAYEAYEQTYLQQLLLQYASGSSSSSGSSTSTETDTSTSYNYTTSDYKNVEAMAATYAGDPTSLAAYLTDMMNADKISSDYANSLYNRYYYGNSSDTDTSTTSTSTSSVKYDDVESAVAKMAENGVDATTAIAYLSQMMSEGLSAAEANAILSSYYDQVTYDIDTSKELTDEQVEKMEWFDEYLPKSIQEKTKDGKTVYVFNYGEYDSYDDAVEAMVQRWTELGNIDEETAEYIRYTHNLPLTGSQSVTGYTQKQKAENGLSVNDAISIYNAIDTAIENRTAELAMEGKSITDADKKAIIDQYKSYFSDEEYNNILKAHGLTVIGGGLDF